MSDGVTLQNGAPPSARLSHAAGIRIAMRNSKIDGSHL
jgi:hypothetical protein